MIIGEEAKKRMHARDVLRMVSEMFHYKYAEVGNKNLEELNNGDKVFYIDNDFNSLIVSNNNLAIVDLIGLAHSTFKVLGFEDILVESKLDLNDYLSLVDIDFEIENKLKNHDNYTETVFNLKVDDEVIAYGGKVNDETLGMNIDYDKLISIISLPMVLELEKEIDALISYEEDNKEIAYYLSISLRMNDIMTEIDYLNKDIPAKYNIIIDSKNLKDNNVKVIDTVLKEEEIININNLIDYFNTHL